MMKLGYMAVGNYGTCHRLTVANKHPRGQLLNKCGRRGAQKIYNDTDGGKVRHVGYIVGGEWFRVYEVHDWDNGNGNG